MSEMVERVARAIAKSRGIGPTTEFVSDDFIWRCYDKERALEEARAAIAAMREPTRAMAESFPTFSDYSLACRGYQAMIDAALT